MVNFWVSFFLLLVSWTISSVVQGVTLFVLMISGLFFTIYFSFPIINKKIVTILLYIFPLLTLHTFSMNLDVYSVWFIFLSLMLDNSRRVTTNESLFYNLYTTAILFIPLTLYFSVVDGLAFLAISFTLTYIVYIMKREQTKKRFYEEHYHEISDENRQIKRQLISGEQLVRQEERNQIARELHDSVGHRLTALLMQLEVSRVKTKDGKSKERFQELKELAQTSLDDTRNAVYTLKSDETTGIQAIIHLIRKLEIESHLEINFIVQSGVFSTQLTNDQSTVVYRTIQESLTNMMRHSQTRKATVEFELLGNRVLQFKVSHATLKKVTIKEGFGIKNMKSRLNELNGTLDLSQEENKLTVIGKFPLHSTELNIKDRKEES